jgi:hypothetical protein
MQEAFSILVALAALLGGLWVIGWAAGDFQPRPGSPPGQGGAPSKPASS